MSNIILVFKCLSYFKKCLFGRFLHNYINNEYNILFKTLFVNIKKIKHFLKNIFYIIMYINIYSYRSGLFFILTRAEIQLEILY